MEEAALVVLLLVLEALGAVRGVSEVPTAMVVAAAAANSSGEVWVAPHHLLAAVRALQLQVRRLWTAGCLCRGHF